MTALGDMTIAWNVAESTYRQLLNILIGTPTALISTAELGARGMDDALTTFANDVLPSPTAQAVHHAVKYMGILRGYRNYYAHGIQLFVQSAQGPIGIIRVASAKGKAISHDERVPLDKIEFVTQHAKILGVYLVNVMVYVGLSQVPKPPPLPEAPALPAKLVKPHRNLRSLWTPPQP